MIDFIEGLLIDSGLHSADDAYFVIQAGGLGYKILTPTTSLKSLPALGNTIKVYTTLIVREDAMTLVGFWQRDERQCFELLIKASGVGVKSALSLLSALSVSELTMAIMSNDYKRLTLAKGIGPKVAQRITLELKDKMQAWRKTVLEHDPHEGDSPKTMGSSSNSVQEEAETVLLSLGYTPAEIYQALQQCSTATNSAELLQHALRWLSLQTHVSI